MIECIRGRKQMSIRSLKRKLVNGGSKDNMPAILRQLSLLPSDRRNIQFINDHYVAVEKFNPIVKLNMPEHIGFTILEISKALMFEFWYEKLMPLYGPEKLRLCFTDTDSLI